MNQKEVFGRGVYVGAKNADYDTFAVLRRKFSLSSIVKARLRVLGLGMFYARINGKLITEDKYLPLATDFETGHDPVGEFLSGHRIYVPEYDITSFLRKGENVLTVEFGGGWYTNSERPFGLPKAIYRLTVETENGELEFVSSQKDKICRGLVSKYDFNKYEIHDYQSFDEHCFEVGFDDSSWENAEFAGSIDTRYLFSDCPADRAFEKLPVRLLLEGGGRRIYDCGKNISGVPVLKIPEGEKSPVIVRLAEELDENGNLDPKYCHGQKYLCIPDGKERTVNAKFMWYGFRYLEVTGNAELLYTQVIHADTMVTCSFKSDNETLNYLFDAFINTQLCNMHSGIPSDCPHLEKRGYTGDGQLIAHSALMMLDAKKFYRKWIEDIADCQDLFSGHVQYTAPYIRSGGGPGGWGCAIIEVPYQYYKSFGDKEMLKSLYPKMRRYFDYLEAHSENDLVVSDKEGEWCLGDWCSPEKMKIPEPFVNNYFYIKSLYRMIEIASVLERKNDIAEYKALIEKKKQAVINAYFDERTGDFAGNRQGSNAFAVDIGLGDGRTYKNMAEFYRGLGRFDTGIFGTDIVMRVLFENNDAEIALSLLCSEDEISFGGQRKKGATSLWEYWTNGRSHSHPMFGAVTVYIFEYVLGIKQTEESVGYKKIKIEPLITDMLNKASGYISAECGKISVEYEKMSDGIHFSFEIPKFAEAVFSFKGKNIQLESGRSEILI